jgi:hypothetical protein
LSGLNSLKEITRSFSKALYMLQKGSAKLQRNCIAEGSRTFAEQVPGSIHA